MKTFSIFFCPVNNLYRALGCLLFAHTVPGKERVDDPVEDGDEEEDEDRVDDLHLVRLDVEAAHLTVHAGRLHTTACTCPVRKEVRSTAHVSTLVGKKVILTAHVSLF